MQEPEDREQISALLYRYLEAVDDGRDPEIVLAELIAGAPDCESRLRRGIQLMREVRLHPGHAAQEGFPDQVGEFRLLHRLGAGGMGVVFAAQQQRLGRQVALKLVRPDQLLFDRAKDRFHREIQSAARLSHTGIASVYEAGEYQGIPWLAQEYVRGASLDRVLQEITTRFPENLTGQDLRNALALTLEVQEAGPLDMDFFAKSWSQVVCRVLQQVAEAVQHAHERGVLHRDLKPSNVILTPKGRAVLVDFGLANLAGADHLTRTGALVGSLAYMAPEQIEGEVEQIGPRTDVYGLGVLLYEMLTLCTPYSSGSVQRLRGLILDGDTPSPSEVNAAIPKDVATVCLCALDRDPQRRYATARDLAEDLRNILARRPIVARPAGRFQRAWRWTQRHPARALGLALSVVVFVVVPIGFGIQRHFAVQSQKRLNNQLNAALQSESNAHKVTQRHRDAAIQAVEAGMRRFADYRLLNVEGASELRLEWIDEALQIFAPLEKEDPHGFSVLREKALLSYSRADVLAELGRYSESLSSYDAAIEIFDSLQTDSRFRAHDYKDYGKALSNRGWASVRLEDFEKAIADFDQGILVFHKAMDVGSDRGKRLADISQTYVEKSNALNQLGRWDESMESAKASQAYAEETVSLEFESAKFQVRMFVALSCEATLYAIKKNMRDAAAVQEKSLTFAYRALELEPDDFDIQGSIALGEYYAGMYFSKLVEIPKARGYLESSVATYQKLIEKFPLRPRYKFLHLKIMGQLGYLSKLEGDLDEAVAVQRQIVERNEELFHSAMENTVYQAELGLAHINLAQMLVAHTDLGRQRLVEASKHAEAAIEYYAPGLAKTPDSEHANEMMIQIYLNAAMLHVNLGQFAEARADLEALKQIKFSSADTFFWEAEVWGGYALALMEQEGAAPQRIEEGRMAMFSALENAVARGFADRLALEAHDALKEFLGEPRMRTLLERMTVPEPKARVESTVPVEKDASSRPQSSSAEESRLDPERIPKNKGG